MDDLALIGLPGLLEPLGRRVAKGDSDRIRSVTTGDVSGDGIALVVIGMASWAEWKGLPAESRPPAYVLLDPAKPLDPLLMHEVFEEGAVGMGPMTEEATLDDVIARWERLRCPDETVSLTVGAKVSRNLARPALVGLGLGLGAEAREGLATTLRSLRVVGDSSTAELIRRAAADWIDLYAYRKHGTGFTIEDQAVAAFARLNGTAQQCNRGFKDEPAALAEFERIFMPPTQERVLPPPILVLGETGTGKSIVAQMIHERLQRHAGKDKLPYHHVNCSSLSEELADGELFGALRGAWTPLDHTHAGAIIASYGGVLFLDELGSLPPRVQAKLLLFLDNGTVVPSKWPGSPIRVPLQIVAATNERVFDLAGEGTFRGDLLHRFRTTIILPALRRTKALELPYLVDSILQEPDVNPGTTVKSVSGEAMERLMAYDFPGNYRELQRLLSEAVRRAVAGRRPILLSKDIEFGRMSLPIQHKVLAVVLREEGGARQVLLRQNPHWRDHFLPSGRVERGESYEASLARELREKIKWEEKDYRAHPLAGADDVGFIDYSITDRKNKYYYFHSFHVTPTKEALEQVSGSEFVWVPVADIFNEADTKLNLWSKLPKFAGLREALLAVDLGDS